MNSYWLYIALGVAIIGGGLVSGFFLTFSDFLMRSLKLAKASAGVQVMQIINREVWHSITIFLLWGMLALSLLLAGAASLTITGPSLYLVQLGGALYFFGVLVVSYAFNIPMNKQLDTYEYSGSEAAAYWNETYVKRWSFWNYVRAIAAGGTAICFLLATALMS